MVHSASTKGCSALVAGLAGRCGLDMVSWLAFGGAAVMTISAA